MREKNTVKNIAAASEAMGETIDMLRLCVRKNADGCNANGTFHTLKLRLWIEKHRQELEAELPDTIEYHKKVGVVKDNYLKDLQIKSKERNNIEPDEVKALLVSIATAQSATLKRLMAELPPKCAGKSEGEIKVETDKAINEFFKILRDKIDNWK